MKYLKIVLAGALFLVMALGVWSVLSPELVEAPTDQETAGQSSEVSTSTQNEDMATTSEATAVPSAPTSAQTKALQAVGIDTEDLSFSAGEVACFKEVLGEERVSEILKGAVPNPLELYKAKDCLGR